MNRSSHPVQVDTVAPLLRVVLVLLLLAAVAAGALVAGGATTGWLTLGFVVVAGPVAVMVDGRARARTQADASRRVSAFRTQARRVGHTPARRAA